MIRVAEFPNIHPTLLERKILMGFLGSSLSQCGTSRGAIRGERRVRLKGRRRILILTSRGEELKLRRAARGNLLQRETLP